MDEFPVILEDVDESGGDVIIYSKPSYAGIKIDGKDTHLLTPQRFRAKAGEREITVWKRGYHPTRKKVEVLPGRIVEEHFILCPATIPIETRKNFKDGAVTYVGVIHVTSTPSKANIFVDGVFIGKVTPEKLALPVDPEPYNISVSKPGYPTVGMNIINTERDQEIHLTLKEMH